MIKNKEWEPSPLRGWVSKYVEAPGWSGFYVEVPGWSECLWFLYLVSCESPDPDTWKQGGKERLVKCPSQPWNAMLPLELLMNPSRQKSPSCKRALLYRGVYSTLCSRVKNTILAPYHFFPLSMKHLKWKWLLSTPRGHVGSDLLSRWADRHGGEFHYTLVFEWQKQLTLGPP